MRFKNWMDVDIRRMLSNVVRRQGAAVFLAADFVVIQKQRAEFALVV
jgi:hypothetical protein